MYPKFSHQSGRVFSKERFLEETVSYFQRNGSGPASREALLDIGLCRGPRDLMGNRCIHGKLGIWDGVGEMDEKSSSTPGLLHQQEAPISGPATSLSVAKFSSPALPAPRPAFEPLKRNGFIRTIQAKGPSSFVTDRPALSGLGSHSLLSSFDPKERRGGGGASPSGSGSYCLLRSGI